MALSEQSIGHFLEHVRATKPTVPAGGCVAGLSGALAAALGRFVIGLSKKTAGDPQWMDRLEAMAGRLAILEKRCLEIMEQDLRACQATFKAAGLSRDGLPDGGIKGMQELALAMIEPPMALTRCAVDILGISLELINKGNPTARADAGVAGEMAYACGRGGLWIARANLDALEEETKRRKMETLDHVETQLDFLYGRLMEVAR